MEKDEALGTKETKGRTVIGEIITNFNAGKKSKINREIFVRIPNGALEIYRRGSVEQIIKEIEDKTNIIISRQCYRMYETGQWKMSLDVFKAICLVLKLEWKEILNTE